MPGVVKILLAKDIPGQNSCMPKQFYPEKLFCDDNIDYAGQSIGLVVAETFQQAVSAARNVKVAYKEIKPPILTIADGIKNNSFFPPDNNFVFGNAEQAILASENKIENDFSMGSQYHFHMENHVATCEPYENYYK
jgi:xanthine dehydrogenase molybdopterin-binding subunit B